MYEWKLEWPNHKYQYFSKICWYENFKYQRWIDKINDKIFVIGLKIGIRIILELAKSLESVGWITKKRIEENALSKMLHKIAIAWKRENSKFIHRLFL